jgi:acetyltransferase-like isoleucine patch superfamily enzyme
LGNGDKLLKFVNAYGCSIGAGTKVGAFVEIQSGARIGENTTVSSHSFICDLVTIGNDVFIGHGVMTINDLFPPSRRRTGSGEYWEPTHIGNHVIIGSNATLFPVRIGDYAVIGAGSVVRKDIPSGQVWAGNPAKYICDTSSLKYKDGKPVFKI